MVSTINFPKTYLKSPLNYIGGKQKIVNQLLPLFPSDISQFVDLFAGGCNIGINVTADKIYCNDNLTHLVEMYKTFQTVEIAKIIGYIENTIETYQLSLTNEEGYKKLRETYNVHKNPLDLFVIISYSFNHQIRFNNNHQFNNPFGRERSSFNSMMKYNLMRFIAKIQEMDIIFSAHNFENFDFSMLGIQDFVYCDPPYLISTGTYNDGKRGFTGWSEKEEYKLLTLLDTLHQKGIKFALSNVVEHKGKQHDLLKNWLNDNSYLNVYEIQMNYANSNYQTLIRDKKATKEVLITNYDPNPVQTTQTLFDDFI